MEITPQNDWLGALERITTRLEKKIKVARRDTSIIVSQVQVEELALLNAPLVSAFETDSN